MKKLILLFLFVAFGASAATSYTEFYVQTSGNNLNAGSTTDNTAHYTGVGDSDGTSVFTPSDGSTPATTVSNGVFGSVYVTSGATVATYVGLITNVAAGVNGAVTFSQVVKAGTFPSASAGAHTITLKTAGAWKGPNGTVGFPFNFATATLTNSSQNVTRVNFKNDAIYSITAAMTHTLAGPIIFQGYTTSPGDIGKASFIDSATAASYVMLNSSGAQCEYADMIFTNAFSSGTSIGVNVTGLGSVIRRVVIHDTRDIGLSLGNGMVAIECETYNCNKGNTANKGGIELTGTGSQAVRCYSHDNTNANACGFLIDGQSTLALNCISANNGKEGFNIRAEPTYVVNCDSYNNGGAGYDQSRTPSSFIHVENCNFIKNGVYGINSSGNLLLRHGTIINCGFGSGTQANGTADIVSGLQGVDVSGSVTYAANTTPWVDPANGNFRINAAAAINAGRGNFTQLLVNSPTNTIGFPDIGAAQTTNTAGASAVTSGYASGQ